MKLIRKLIVGISTICLLVMTFVSATYAWFEINSRASVENFHFEVHGGQGFLVSIDNVNYYNDLSLIQLQKAMLVAFNNERYKIADDGSETLYFIDYEEGIDENGQPTRVEILKSITDDSVIHNLVNENIKLNPSTTKNGRNFTDLYNAPTRVNTGDYLEFSIYFRTQSKRIEDNFAYDIYLNGEETIADDGSFIEPTSITSTITEVKLNADMNAVTNTPNGKYVRALKRNNSSNGRDKIIVYSSNAVRLSITDQEYYENYEMNGDEYVLDENGNKVITEKGYRLVGDNPTKIYELNDTVNKNTDLGSYATDYTGEYTEDELNAMITEEGTMIEDENLALYCSKFNAMYTYYNNLKPDAKITHINYDDMPTTIKDLSNQSYITRVVAGEEAKLLTFRLWLEGWDADCFDGLMYGIKVKLAFGSKRVEF